MRRRLFAPLLPPQRPRESLGGAKPVVQQSAERVTDAGTIPMLVSRVYVSPSIQHYDESDPRFAGKANNVENIYLPAGPQFAEKKPARSGIAQTLNWLFTGKME